MSTWYDDLKKTNPALAADYAIVGNQDTTSLKNMIKALSLFGGRMNTTEENERLAAAKRIVKARARR